MKLPLSTSCQHRDDIHAQWRAKKTKKNVNNNCPSEYNLNRPKWKGKALPQHDVWKKVEP